MNTTQVCGSGASRLTVLVLAGLISGGCTVNATGSPDGGGGGGTTSTTGDDGGVGKTADGGASDTTDGGGGAVNEDGATSASDSSAPTGGDDGGPGEGGVTPEPPGCIKNLYGTYTVRTDGVAVNEGSSETVVIDDASGTNSTPLTGVQSVQQQELAACAVVTGGTVKCWQEDATNGNAYGQLGNGTKTPIAVYRAVTVLTAANTPLSNVVSLAPGEVSNAACAVTSDSKLWCWGALTWLANGGTQDYAGYAQMISKDGQTPLTGVIQAAIGENVGCALVQGSPNNSVWCWGSGGYDELGQGTSTNQQYPVEVKGLTSPTKVMLSLANRNVGCNGCGGPAVAACAMDGDSVLCWGANNNGATGGSPNVNPVPAATQVVTSTMTVLRGVTDIQEGWVGFGVVRNDGTIWLWGSPDGNTAYAKTYGVTNVVQLGWAGGNSAGLRYLTSDGIYHTGMTSPTVSCSF
jgi:hypothetical protein